MNGPYTILKSAFEKRPVRTSLGTFLFLVIGFLIAKREEVFAPGGLLVFVEISLISVACTISVRLFVRYMVRY